MRTPDTALDVTFAGKPAALRLIARVQGLVMVWRLLNNRRAAGHLHDLDDRQLADIGLSRTDVRDATTSPFFEDPSRHLTRAARERANRYYRDARSR
ncbi:hypothetical protein ASG39_04835 [Rhizobium sp. Leaf371]|uniref:DUF1127 domain-containing protein n=1 Tax=unclassified Rhizobium TaxID=2613769 RepID=UPI0007163C89|nr:MULTISPECIES: DUF1127 domain-containing protein [unclassified Rhizobium]KQS67716.1 hypothetical protein ASG39_04835 [Rhizobium sp. Leaf371]TCM55910.1 uncharacterized protein DUF1127 [Rhizobium sp. PP-F2F-G48]